MRVPTWTSREGTIHLTGLLGHRLLSSICPPLAFVPFLLLALARSLSLAAFYNFSRAGGPSFFSSSPLALTNSFRTDFVLSLVLMGTFSLSVLFYMLITSIRIRRSGDSSLRSSRAPVSRTAILDDPVAIGAAVPKHTGKRQPILIAFDDDDDDVSLPAAASGRTDYWKGREAMAVAEEAAEGADSGTDYSCEEDVGSGGAEEDWTNVTRAEAPVLELSVSSSRSNSSSAQLPRSRTHACAHAHVETQQSPASRQQTTAKATLRMQPPPPPARCARGQGGKRLSARTHHRAPARATMSPRYKRQLARMANTPCEAGPAGVCTTPGGGHSSVQYRPYCTELCYFAHLRSQGKEIPKCKFSRKGCNNFAFRGRQCNRGQCQFAPKKKKTKLEVI